MSELPPSLADLEATSRKLAQEIEKLTKWLDNDRQRYEARYKKEMPDEGRRMIGAILPLQDQAENAEVDEDWESVTLLLQDVRNAIIRARTVINQQTNANDPPVN